MRLTANIKTEFKPYLDLLRKKGLTIVTEKIPENHFWGGYYKSHVTDKKLGGTVYAHGDGGFIELRNNPESTTDKSIAALLNWWESFPGMKLASLSVDESTTAATSGKCLRRIEFMSPLRKKVAAFLENKGLKIITEKDNDGKFYSFVTDKKLGGLAGISTDRVWSPIVSGSGATKNDSRLSILDRFIEATKIIISPTGEDGRLLGGHSEPLRTLETHRFDVAA